MSEREKARERWPWPSRADTGLCVAKIRLDDGRVVECCKWIDAPIHNEYRNVADVYGHAYLPPSRTLRERLRDVALWLTPPGWVITLGLLASIVALALLFFDAVPR